MTTVQAWIGLGANLGDARATLEAALQALNALPGTRLLRRSSFYRSAPVDADGPDFINAVACCETAMAPLDLLHEMQRIELAYGRQRPYYHAPRTLDLDLLLYGNQTMQTAELMLPHPAIGKRAFVLLPLAELDMALWIPGQGNVKDLLPQVQDQRIERLSAVAGTSTDGISGASG